MRLFLLWCSDVKCHGKVARQSTGVAGFRDSWVNLHSCRHWVKKLEVLNCESMGWLGVGDCGVNFWRLQK